MIPQAAPRHGVEAGLQTSLTPEPELWSATWMDTFHCDLGRMLTKYQAGQSSDFPNQHLQKMRGEDKRASNACLNFDNLCSQVVGLGLELRILTARCSDGSTDAACASARPASIHAGGRSCPGKRSTLCHFKYIYIYFKGLAMNFVKATRPHPWNQFDVFLRL